MSWLIPIQTVIDTQVCEGKSPTQKCRYFATDENRPVCLKLNKELRALIDKEVEFALQEKRARVVQLNDVYFLDAPIGDNCPGVLMEL